MADHDKAVTTRAQLISHIHSLLRARRNGDPWENERAEDFLEALAAWLQDCNGYYRNVAQTMDVENASWQLFADSVSAATVYE